MFCRFTIASWTNAEDVLKKIERVEEALDEREYQYRATAGTGRYACTVSMKVGAKDWLTCSPWLHTRYASHHLLQPLLM